jgi:DNA-binding XRE family transcriptional regulator
MVLRESLDPDSSIWHWMAVDLHFYRTKHGFSCAQLGKTIGCNRQSVSNMEAARPGWRLDDDQAAKLDKLWDLNGHFGRLLRYARARHDADWFAQHLTYEKRATEMRTYEALIVPGLLQTEAYARALLVAGQVVPDVDAAVAARLARQEVLDKDTPPLLWVLLNESVLHQPVGGPQAMRAQLAQLLDISERPNIVLRVVPRSLGAHTGLDGSFKITTVEEGDIAYMEAVGGGRMSLDKAEIRRYRIRYDRIGSDALSRDSTRNLLAQLMETMT